MLEVTINHFILVNFKIWRWKKLHFIQLGLVAALVSVPIPSWPQSFGPNIKTRPDAGENNNKTTEISNALEGKILLKKKAGLKYVKWTINH